MFINNLVSLNNITINIICLQLYILIYMLNYQEIFIHNTMVHIYFLKHNKKHFVKTKKIFIFSGNVLKNLLCELYCII
ncbi:hypothetical protein PFUGPA_01660 [Plasmodium falciparum Palo Alto/Uganda]|uniref:Uncharacterized protein n=2 Tax=Plasmodium falciparum TaxID=5833 RepID=W4J236_PLAFP|nr:hypothetical protein PFTANZ_03155 [Plasmodium falciparum Tanzania (2000708)]ETW56348.1 hypothetical protein PFUGPA_01660 [Plasmodium falciparum Palo Alto/Uganda]